MMLGIYDMKCVYKCDGDSCTFDLIILQNEKKQHILYGLYMLQGIIDAETAEEDLLESRIYRLHINDLENKLLEEEE